MANIQNLEQHIESVWSDFYCENYFPLNFFLGAIESSDSHITGLDVSFAHSKFRNGEEWADVERRAIVNRYPCYYHFTWICSALLFMLSTLWREPLITESNGVGCQDLPYQMLEIFHGDICWHMWFIEVEFE